VYLFTYPSNVALLFYSACFKTDVKLGSDIEGKRKDSVLENRAHRTIFGLKRDEIIGWRKWHNVELLAKLN
jgi:hypothetical protein